MFKLGIYWKVKKFDVEGSWTKLCYQDRYYLDNIDYTKNIVHWFTLLMKQTLFLA